MPAPGCLNLKQHPLVNALPSATAPDPSLPPSTATPQPRSRRRRSARHWPAAAVYPPCFPFPSPSGETILEARNDTQAGPPPQPGCVVHPIPTTTRANQPRAVDNRRPAVHRKDPARPRTPGEPLRSTQIRRTQAQSRPRGLDGPETGHRRGPAPGAPAGGALDGGTSGRTMPHLPRLPRQTVPPASDAPRPVPC